MALVDRIGQKFGNWTVVGVAPYQGTAARVYCRCKCGVTKAVHAVNLTTGRTRGCVRCGLARRRKVANEYRAKKFLDRGLRFKEVRGMIIPLCVECGDPVSVTAVNGLGRCLACANKARVGREVPSNWKHSRSMQSVGDEFGVSKQRVQQVIAERGWKGMLSYFRTKKKEKAA